MATSPFAVFIEASRVDVFEGSLILKVTSMVVLDFLTASMSSAGWSKCLAMTCIKAASTALKASSSAKDLELAEIERRLRFLVPSPATVIVVVTLPETEANEKN